MQATTPITRSGSCSLWQSIIFKTSGARKIGLMRKQNGSRKRAKQPRLKQKPKPRWIWKGGVRRRMMTSQARRWFRSENSVPKGRESLQIEIHTEGEQIGEAEEEEEEEGEKQEEGAEPNRGRRMFFLCGDKITRQISPCLRPGPQLRSIHLRVTKPSLQRPSIQGPKPQLIPLRRLINLQFRSLIVPW